MNRSFVRNFFIFTIILAVCSGTLGFTLVRGERELEKTDELIMHTHKFITNVIQLSSLTEGVLASQRGYLLTSDATFLDDYKAKKNAISNNLAELSLLSEGQADQESRLAEARNYLNLFFVALEDKISLHADNVEAGRTEIVTNAVERIDSLRDDIMRLTTSMLNSEYARSEMRVAQLESRKGQYFSSLFIGGICTTLLLFILNAFLLQAQRKRTRAETYLKGMEERLYLALEGTRDGIFDWDIVSGKIYFSKRFFEIIGYEDKGDFYGTPDDMQDYIHPEDYKRIWEYVDSYLNGEIEEYVQEYRMKHKSGRWVWIQSRATAIFDDKGKPIRMVGAHTDITPIMKNQKKLEAEKNEAQDANRAKSEFLAHMSHEIRTPLTAISGIAEILMKNYDSFNEKQQRLVKTLGSSTESLKDLINDVLDFSKIEGGELELDEGMFELDKIFEQTISMMSLKANEKGISFLFDYSVVKDREFYGDSKRIRQILINLIANAIKFTDLGGVTIKAYFDDRDGEDYLHIDVTDTGIGIAPEDFDLVFERFKQADSSVSRRYGGTGLGLPISRQLARLMGGDIFLSSEVGKGSTFRVFLPAKAKGVTANSNKREYVLDDELRSVVSDENNVLIVEDYEGNIMLLSFILDELNLAYDVATSGKQAVEKFKDNHYDVIMMDVQMPEMDGFTATKIIRQIEAEKNMGATPIIGMTAHALVGDKDKCIEAGMDVYLAKPLITEEVKIVVLKYLEEANARKKAA